MQEPKRFNLGNKSISTAGFGFLCLLILGLICVALASLFVHAPGFLLACVVSGYALLSLLKRSETFIEDRLE